MKERQKDNHQKIEMYRERNMIIQIIEVNEKEKVEKS